MSTSGPEMTSEMGPAIEQVVSERAWNMFPQLQASVFEWAGLSGAEASDIVVSAVPIGMDWISVRVTRVEGPDNAPVDWLEWLAPLVYKGASQSAIDHFAARALDGAARSLRGSDGELRGVADFPPVPAPGSQSSDGTTMAKKLPTPEPRSRTRPAAAPTPASKPASKAARSSKPAEMSKPAPAKAASRANAKPSPAPTKSVGKSKAR